jgi:ABC-type transport system substrate-binding protein
VKFHDGSNFDADAVVWNVEKVLKQDAAHFDASQAGLTVSRMPSLRGARKIDAMTVELTTAQPDSLLPINLTNLYMASPAHWKKLYNAVPASVSDLKERAKWAWEAFSLDPSGTGPWKMARIVPRERLELVKNAGYWDAKRIPIVVLASGECCCWLLQVHLCDSNAASKRSMFSAAHESWRSPADSRAGRVLNFSCGFSRGFRRLAFG